MFILFEIIFNILTIIKKEINNVIQLKIIFNILTIMYNNKLTRLCCRIRFIVLTR